MNSVPDKLFINLRKLGKIQKNGKISRSYDGIIYLDHTSIFQPLKRFFFGDSRKHSLTEINSIINEAIITLQSIIGNRFTSKTHSDTDEFRKNYENIKLIITEFEAACKGIQNLKFTYANDNNIAPQLDVIIIKMNSSIRDTRKKLRSLNMESESDSDPDPDHEPEVQMKKLS